jgi:hypothetical protein
MGEEIVKMGKEILRMVKEIIKWERNRTRGAPRGM